MSTTYERSTATRVLATELNEADYQFKEEEGEKSPSYLLLPSGGKANRIATTGTLTSVSDVSSQGDDPYWIAEVNDGTGSYNVQAGSRYQPEAAASLQQISNDVGVPCYVNVVGKTNEYRPDDEENRVIISVQPEYVVEVNEQERNNLLLEACERTVDRLETNEGKYVRQSQDRYGDRTQLLEDDIRTVLGKLQ